MHHLPTGTVTFLFTDIEGSTNLVRTLGPRWPGVLQEHYDILRTAILDHGGVEVRTEGDAFFAVFGSAVDAVAATAAAQRAMVGHAWPLDGAIRVRMGLHTGEGRLSQATTWGWTSTERLESPRRDTGARSCSRRRPGRWSRTRSPTAPASKISVRTG
jgi:class 3 adenylate cyclase